MDAADRARRAVAVAFALNGFTFASWASRVPAVRARLGLTDGRMGLLLLALSMGTLVALPLSGAVVHRLGTARTVVAGAGVVAAGLLLVSAGLQATAVVPVALGLGLYGVGISAWDVAMNVEGAAVEHSLGRALLPRLHGAFSLGTVGGAAVGAAAAATGLGVAPQLVLSVAVVVPVVTVASRSFVEADTDDTVDQPHALRAWLERRTLLVGVVVLAFALVEGVANDWVAVGLVDGHHASQAVGALGFGGFVVAMTAGRLFGGAVAVRRGRVTVLRATAVLALAGVALTVASPSLVVAFAGVLLWGVGASLGFPLGMAAAADDPRRAAGRVAVASSIGYTAFLGGPPLVGFLADRFGTLHALTVALMAAALGLVVCQVAAERPPAW